MSRASSLRLRPMLPRDPHESGRTASTLELFFDLVFVIAVSITAVQLHHSLSEGHVGAGILSYAMVFFAIWWAWMNFTWFATSFDTDDWLYRVLTIVQMGGVLVLAAGVVPAFQDHDFRLAILAYIVMRLALVAQWLRASRHTPLRRTALTYAGGVVVVQGLWVLFLLVPAQLAIPAFIVFALCELAVPVLAERSATTPWNPHHITERYGLFALILLGESLLASANAVIEAVGEGEHIGELVAISVLALIVTAALWWIYFWAPHHTAITDLRGSITYGYGHIVVFAAAGALSAGIEAEIDYILGHSHLSALGASFAYTVPIAVFVLGIWVLAIRRHGDAWVNTCVPLGAVLVLIDPLLPVPFALTTIIMVGVVAVLVWRRPVGVEAAHAG
ncbi:low temperature requirement protein A [Brachybacterium phenoliresistens]|uniref:low temperature requirement protein A n=1 Tax=Brachybacterium phenoliresistens TaxID=396014 RepID=UPI0031E104BB